MAYPARVPYQLSHACGPAVYRFVEYVRDTNGHLLTAQPTAAPAAVPPAAAVPAVPAAAAAAAVAAAAAAVAAAAAAAAAVAAAAAAAAAAPARSGVLEMLSILEKLQLSQYADVFVDKLGYDDPTWIATLDQVSK